MPYIDSDTYIENDFRDLEIDKLTNLLSSFQYHLKRETYKPFFAGFTPSLEDTIKDIEEFCTLGYKANPLRYGYVKPTKEETKRRKELQKVICDTLIQWGEQIVEESKKGKISIYNYGFPYVYLSGLRRPTTTPNLSYEIDKKTKSQVTLSIKKETKPLTLFNWEISANGGVTWKLIRKTKDNTCRVTKLEPGQTYHFRYYISNPKGRSDNSGVREVKLPGIAGKPAVSIKKYPANGALGALLDEYRRAVTELKEVIQPLKAMHLTGMADYSIKDENCRSIQTILAHVVSAGHNYIVEIRKKMGEELKYYDKELLETPDKYRLALNGMFNYAVPLFEDYPNLASEELDIEKKIKTQSGQLYDVEQMMEHAIVHVLRHRRQVERFLGKMTF